jgi:hypothetical protein
MSRSDLNNVLELSDEEVMQMELPFASEEPDVEGSAVSAENDPDTLDDEENDPSEEEDVADDDTVLDDADGDSDTDDDDGESADSANEAETTDADVTDEEEEEDATETEATSAVDYKAEYERILAPFKANGKEIKVDSVDEAIQLMQMGANYNKKMAALKPSLKILKALESNDLLDEDKINFLIDLGKKNPDAISKLIRDSGIDPLDVDVDGEADYKPNTYTANDKEIELDAVLEEIQDTPAYSQTIDIISNKWDDASRQVLVNNPHIIRLINAQVESGLFEQINQVMEKRRVLGQLGNMSDIEAYKMIGDELFLAQANNPAQAPVEKPIIKKPAEKKPDPEVAKRKKAAAATKGKPAAKPSADFNPLSMSDEEFEKVLSKQYF